MLVKSERCLLVKVKISHYMLITCTSPWWFKFTSIRCTGTMSKAAGFNMCDFSDERLHKAGSCTPVELVLLVEMERQSP